MIIPIVSIPKSIEEGLKIYRDIFSRSETYEHIKEYCLGLVILGKPSINRLSRCLVKGSDQSSINRAITSSPWSEEEMNSLRIKEIKKYYKGRGLVCGIIDTVFMHHERGEKIYGVYKYWDYVNGCYTKAIRLVTSAVAVEDRCDGFDYRIYHRSFKEEEKAYLENEAPVEGEKDRNKLENYIVDLLSHHLNQKKFKDSGELGVEMIDKMECSEIEPDVYLLDSGMFVPEIIKAVKGHNKHWIADSSKTRILYYKGEKYNCGSFTKSRPDSVFRKITLKVKGEEKDYWIFTCVVRIKKYGKVRFTAIYDNENRQGDPIYCFTDMLNWDGKKITSIRSRRWKIEPLHEQSKQFEGAEDSQLQNEQGVRKHLTLVFVMNSLLKSLHLDEPIGDLPMNEFDKNVQPTFGQRCRRIIFEVFYDLIQQIHKWIDEGDMTIEQIFKTLFKKLLYA
jgi:hypothetical protein